MLSGKLIHLIESHEEEIAASILRSIHRDPDLAHLGNLPEPELRERGRDILKNLGHWLAHGGRPAPACRHGTRRPGSLLG